VPRAEAYGLLIGEHRVLTETRRAPSSGKGIENAVYVEKEERTGHRSSITPAVPAGIDTDSPDPDGTRWGASVTELSLVADGEVVAQPPLVLRVGGPLIVEPRVDGSQ
jgi:hypothetical protein